MSSHPVPTRSPFPRKTAAFLVGFAVTAAFVLMGDRTDRSAWSELPCIADRTETYRYQDDRPHKQGGRGEMLTGRRSVCIERATIGPVMPKGWTPA